MNEIYSLVWNESSKSLVVVSEITTKCRKSLTRLQKGPFGTIKYTLLLILVLFSSHIYAYEVNGSAGTSDSIAIGGAAGTCESSTNAISPSSIAIGCNTAVSGGGGGVALGNGASVQKTNGVAIGTNATAVKESSIAIGTNSVAGDALNNFDFQVAIGNNAHATAQNSLAVGDQSLASGVQSTAVGSGSIANAAQASAFGRLSSAGNNGTAVGMNAKATSTRSTALGQGATATATDGTAIGQGASVTANSSVALGRGSVASRDSSVSIGSVGSERQLVNLAAGAVSSTSTDGINGSQLFNTNTFITSTLGGGSGLAADGTMLSPSYNLYNASNGTTATTDNIGTAFEHFNSQGLKYFHANSSGADAQANGVNSLAIGSAALAQNDNSIALGANSVTAATIATASSMFNGTTYNFAGNSPVGTLSIGGAGVERTVTNVAAGRLSGASTDAVNGSQLFATNQALSSLDTSIGGLDDRAIKYDLNADNSVNYGQATLVGTGGTKLTNVAAGELSATSTDAVNGSQLNATNDNVATNTANIATNTSNINGLKDDALQWDTAANGGNGAYSANHMGNGPARITNVAAGELSSTSSDAVNGSQLYSTNQQVALNTSGLTEIGNNVSTLQQDALLWDPSLSAFSTKHGSTAINKITNVANADLSASSTDAVNGSQLYSTNNRVSQIENVITNIDMGSMKYVSVNSQGPAASALGTEAISVGPGATASGDNSIATGNNAQSTGSAAIALGSDASASGDNSIAVGSTASSTADNAVALGAGSIADRNNTVSVGSTDNQRQITNLAAGTEDTDAVNVAQLKSITNTVSTVNADINELDNGTDGMFQVNNTSVKAKPQATGKDALAGGAGSSASAENSMAVGTGAQSSGINSVALGSAASATAQNSVALGTNSLADRDNTVSVGSVGGERQITNVAAGTQGTDAVNLNQLNSGIGSANQYTDNKFNTLKNMVDDNKDKMSAGIAGAMAMASLTQPYTPGASMFSIGSAAYQNQSAIALGVSTISESGKWVTKLQGNSNTQGDMGIAVGVGYQW